MMALGLAAASLVTPAGLGANEASDGAGGPADVPSTEMIVQDGAIDCQVYARSSVTYGGCPGPLLPGAPNVGIPNTHNSFTLLSPRGTTPITGAVYNLEWDHQLAHFGRDLQLKFPLPAANPEIEIESNGAVTGGFFWGNTYIAPSAVWGDSALTIRMRSPPGAEALYPSGVYDAAYPNFSVSAQGSLGTGPTQEELGNPLLLVGTVGIVKDMPFRLCVAWVFDDAALPPAADDPCM